MRRLLRRNRSASPRNRSVQDSREKGRARKHDEENDAGSAGGAAPGGWAAYHAEQAAKLSAAALIQRVARGRRERIALKETRRHHTAKRYTGEYPRGYSVVQWESTSTCMM